MEEIRSRVEARSAEGGSLIERPQLMLWRAVCESLKMSVEIEKSISNSCKFNVRDSQRWRSRRLRAIDWLKRRKRDIVTNPSHIFFMDLAPSVKM